MIDTANKRAAALGFGLAFLLVIPQAEGALSVESAGHALSAYRFDLDDQNLETPDGDIIQIAADVSSVRMADDVRQVRLEAVTTVRIPTRRRP